MYNTPDGKTFETYAEYADALVRYKWEAGRAERTRKMQEERATRSAFQRQPQTGNWDATYPAHMRRRHNLAGR